MEIPSAYALIAHVRPGLFHKRVAETDCSVGTIAGLGPTHETEAVREERVKHQLVELLQRRVIEELVVHFPISVLRPERKPERVLLHTERIA